MSNMNIRTIEYADGELYLNKDDVLDWLMEYSEDEDMDLEGIMAIRGLYDVLKLCVDHMEEYLEMQEEDIEYE